MSVADHIMWLKQSLSKNLNESAMISCGTGVSSDGLQLFEDISKGMLIDVSIFWQKQFVDSNLVRGFPLPGCRNIRGGSKAGTPVSKAGTPVSKGNLVEHENHNVILDSK